MLPDEFKIKMASSSSPKINATKIVLVKLGINNIGILVFFIILRIQMVGVLVIKCYLFDKNPACIPGRNLNFL